MSKGTTKRSIRIEQDLWEQATVKAGSEGAAVSDVIRRLLREWLNNNEGEK